MPLLPYSIYVNPRVRDVLIPSLNEPFFRIPGVVNTNGGAAGMDMLSAMGTFSEVVALARGASKLWNVGICAASKSLQS